MPISESSAICPNNPYEHSKYIAEQLCEFYSISVKQVIEVVLEILNIEKKIICEDSQRKNEMNDVVADITKANRELNWYPKYSFLDGIKKIIDGEIVDYSKAIFYKLTTKYIAQD